VPPPQLPSGRGGRQEIPRPDTWRLGGPPPWTGLRPRSSGVELSEVRARLEAAGPPPPPPEVPDTAQASAVLAALFERDGDTQVVLTRRSWDLRHHTGEMSFPGGRADATDADLAATALREAEEEVGLDPAEVEIIGQLDTITTVSGRSLIVPFVGVLDDEPELRPEPGEVDAIVIVAFAELLLAEVWREEVWEISEIELEMRFFELVGDTVWGATAVMLRQLLGISVGLDRSAVAPSSRRWRDVAAAIDDAGLAGPDPL